MFRSIPPEASTQANLRLTETPRVKIPADSLHSLPLIMRFQHAPLQATQIRLLSYTTDWPDLDPNTRTPKEPCLLCETFDRATAPPYTALSYEWGDDSCVRKITINGQSLFVRDNLRNALINLPLHITGYLWIDALCIDQANTTERNHQVKVMGQIYSQARLVVAWLGLYDESLRPCMAPTTNDSLDSVVASCSALLLKPYWQRLWIWQELILAKHTLLVCESRSLSFERFRQHIEYNFVDWNPLAYVICTTMNQGPILTLWEAMSNFSSCHCSEPRDKVFAVLGTLVSREHAALSTVFPNYALGADSIALTVLSHLRQFREQGQYDICRDAERIICALGARPCTVTSKFAAVLRDHETSLQRSRRQSESEHTGATDRNRWRGKREGSRDANGRYVPPEAFDAPVIRNSLLGRVPGMTLTMVKVFDCLFGWQHSALSYPRISASGNQEPDFWAIDAPGASMPHSSGTMAPRRILTKPNDTTFFNPSSLASVT